MTTEEAIRKFEIFRNATKKVLDSNDNHYLKNFESFYREKIEMAELAISALRAQQERDRNSTMIVAKLREFASMNPPVCEWDKDNHGPVYCKPYEPWQETAREAADIIERYEKGQHRAKQEQENNAPLTMDELRQMEGEPVWIKLFDQDEEFWVLRNEWVDTRNPEPLILFHMRWYSHADYGKTWLAYRHKPEEGTV